MLHAGQGATATMLLAASGNGDCPRAGKPLLLLPLVLEQRLTADAVVRLGAGERAAANDPAAVGEKLDVMLGSDGHATAARAFAAKYADFDPAAQVERMAGRGGGAAEGGTGHRRRGGGSMVGAGVFRA